MGAIFAPLSGVPLGQRPGSALMVAVQRLSERPRLRMPKWQ